MLVFSCCGSNKKKNSANSDGPKCFGRASKLLSIQLSFAFLVVVRKMKGAAAIIRHFVLQPALQSSVVATSQDLRSRQASIEEQTKDKRGQAR